MDMSFLQIRRNTNSFKGMQGKVKNHFIAVIISILIVSMLILSGPYVVAFNVSVTTDETSYLIGIDDVEITAEITFLADDILPISAVNLNVSGLSPFNCSLPFGTTTLTNYAYDCGGVSTTINRTPQSSLTQGYGYGYGYWEGSTPSYGYYNWSNLGYGYYYGSEAISGFSGLENFTDSFTGVSINTSRYTVTDVSGVTVTQDENISISGIAGDTDALGILNTNIAVDADETLTATANLSIGVTNLGAGETAASFIGFYDNVTNAHIGCELYEDNVGGNFLRAVNSSGSTAAGVGSVTESGYITATWTPSTNTLTCNYTSPPAGSASGFITDVTFNDSYYLAIAGILTLSAANGENLGASFDNLIFTTTQTSAVAFGGGSTGTNYTITYVTGGMTEGTYNATVALAINNTAFSSISSNYDLVMPDYLSDFTETFTGVTLNATRWLTSEEYGVNITQNNKLLMNGTADLGDDGVGEMVTNTTDFGYVNMSKDMNITVDINLTDTTSTIANDESIEAKISLEGVELDTGITCIVVYQQDEGGWGVIATNSSDDDSANNSLTTGNGTLTMMWNASTENVTCEFGGMLAHITEDTLADYNDTKLFVMGEVSYNADDNNTLYAEFDNLVFDTPPLGSDTVAPQYVLVSPTTDISVYYNDSTQQHYINVTWTDDRAIDTVLLEWDGTNYSVTDTVGDTYYYSFTGLGRGKYTWRECTNDTANNLNCTPEYSYEILDAGGGGGGEGTGTYATPSNVVLPEEILLEVGVNECSEKDVVIRALSSMNMIIDTSEKIKFWSNGRWVENGVVVLKAGLNTIRIQGCAGDVPKGTYMEQISFKAGSRTIHVPVRLVVTATGEADSSKIGERETVAQTPPDGQTSLMQDNPLIATILIVVVILIAVGLVYWKKKK